MMNDFRKGAECFSKTSNRIMNYNIYLDESGNTGNIELRDDLKWNYGNQPHFSLGALYIEEEKVKDIEQKIIEILHDYDPALGTERELKSRAKYVFKNELLKEITELLVSEKTGFYFDIANKKYKAIITIVEYCVYPFFVSVENILNRSAKVDAANVLYKTLPDEDIKYYIDLCQDVRDESEKIESLIYF